MMKPTNNLRFVEREALELSPQYGPNVARVTKIRVLQQMWVSDSSDEADEWRDVPLEKEQ